MDGGLRAAGERFSCCWNTSNGHHQPINLVRGTPGAAQFPPGIVSYNQLAPVPAAPLEPRPARAFAHGGASSELGPGAPAAHTSARPAIKRLAEVKAPVLIVVGDLDMPESLEIADMLERGIAGAKKRAIAGTAHRPQIENPAEFNRVVMEFLSGVQDTRGGMEGVCS